MYTIKHAAALVGVSDSTLRAWESRYGLSVSQRTGAGYRLYDDAAIALLRRVHELIRSGWVARQAVAEVMRQSEPPRPTTTGGTTFDTTVLADVAADFDTARLSRVLDEHFTAASFESVVDDWLLPALVDLGTAWQTGRVTVAGEHLVAHAVGRRLAHAYDAAAVARTTPDVVVGLPPGARHDLGLLAFAAAARRSGLATSFLGADVPLEDWAAAAGARIRCVVLAVPMAADAEPLARTVAAIRERSPALTIAVGGSAQDLSPDGCLRLGHSIGDAAVRLTDALAGARAP